MYMPCIIFLLSLVGAWRFLCHSAAYIAHGWAFLVRLQVCDTFRELQELTFSENVISECRAFLNFALAPCAAARLARE